MNGIEGPERPPDRRAGGRTPVFTGRRLRALSIAWLHLAVLWAFGFAQPLFDVLADSPEFFVARGNTSWDIVILALGVTLVPPTALAAVELLLLPLDRPRRWVHLLFVATLAAAIALQILKDAAGGSSAVLLPLSIALGALAALAYERSRVVPAALTVLAPAPVVFLVLFLVVSPVSKLVFPSDVEAGARAKVQTDIPVVYVILDELSIASMLDDDRRLDRDRFPGFARLARSMTWYRNATTVADETKRAVPALLTGQLVRDDDALPIAADHPNNLFTLLGRDYAFDVRESVTKLCRGSRCRQAPTAPASDRLQSLVSDLSVVSLHLLLPRDLEADLAPVDRTFAGFGDSKGRGARAANRPLERRKQTFEAFIRGLRPGPRPTLHFLHVQLPHVPYEYLPDGHRYPLANGLRMPGLLLDTWVSGLPPLRNAYERYLLQLSLADRMIERMQERLRATGLWRRALVIVAADHGVSFRPGGRRRRATPRTFADIAGVPLFVKAPGQTAGGVNDGRARTVDVLPTIADALDIRLPWRADGRSLLTRPVPAQGPVTVEVEGGGTVTTPFARYRGLLRTAATRLGRLLEAFGGTSSIYASGRDGRLVGRTVSSLPAAAPVSSELELDSPSSFAAVDPSAETVPALMSGVLGASDAGTRLAIAVDDRIVATTEAFRDTSSSAGGPTRFLGLAAPDAFRRGNNVVRLYRIEGEGRGLRLARYQSTGESRLVGDQVVLASGRRIRLSDDFKGFLEVIDVTGDVLGLAGWAADPSHGRVPDRVLVFAGGRLLGSGTLGRLRPDLAKVYDRRVLGAGFRLQLATDRARELSDPDRLRVVALGDGHASELSKVKQLSGG